MDFILVKNVNAKKGIVITPSTSGLNVIFAKETMSSDQSSLARKYRRFLKMPEKQLDLNSFFNSKMIARLNCKKDSILYHMVRALEKKKEIQTSKSGSYYNHFYKDLHTFNGLLVMDNMLCLPFVLRTAAMKFLHKTHPGQFGMKFFRRTLVPTYQVNDVLPREKLLRLYRNRKKTSNI